MGRFTSANNRMAFVSHMPKRHVAILSRYDTKKAMDIGRQTVFVETDKLGKPVDIPLRGKKVKSITIELVDLKSFLKEGP